MVYEWLIVGWLTIRSSKSSNMWTELQLTPPGIIHTSTGNTHRLDVFLLLDAAPREDFHLFHVFLCHQWSARSARTPWPPRNTDEASVARARAECGTKVTGLVLADRGGDAMDCRGQLPWRGVRCYGMVVVGSLLEYVAVVYCVLLEWLTVLCIILCWSFQVFWWLE